jgi:hypothetical protein
MYVDASQKDRDQVFQDYEIAEKSCHLIKEKVDSIISSNSAMIENVRVSLQAAKI